MALDQYSPPMSVAEKPADRLVWIDLEMTGLDPEVCEIVEIATIVTDNQLRTIAEGPNLLIRPSAAAMKAMPAEVLKMHTDNGLLRRIEEEGIAAADAEAQTMTFVQSHVGPRLSPLCGNSVHKDREFLVAYMPTLAKHFHYRNIDVSTVKELVRRWYPATHQAPPKGDKHRALDDIRESIAELAWYRGKVFAQNP